MSFYDATVPAFLQILGSLSAILGKAEAHCQAKGIQPEVILSTRLYPDMLPFARQIQLVCDFAAKGCARLTGSELPSTPDTEKTFEELRQRIARTIDYVKSFKPAQFDGAEARDVTFPAGPNNPVGVVWIGTSREHYGLHGTPEPSRIGSTESHGCVRLTNWDAARVASLVKPGTPVLFR